jgi:hypothetical protein
MPPVSATPSRSSMNASVEYRALNVGFVPTNLEDRMPAVGREQPDQPVPSHFMKMTPVLSLLAILARLRSAVSIVRDSVTAVAKCRASNVRRLLSASETS